MPGMNPFIAITAATAISLASASALQVSQWMQYQNMTQAAQSCLSWSLFSGGDPHIITAVGGNQLSDELHDDAIDNFVTVRNTVGGSTQFSTETAQMNTGYINTDVTVKNADAGWSIHARPVGFENSTVSPTKTTVTDASGDHVIKPNSTMTLSDGTVITTNANGDPTIVQKLNQGGVLATDIVPNTENWAGLSVDVKGNGQAIINGFATQRASGGYDDALLPCFTPGSRPIAEATPAVDGTPGPGQGAAQTPSTTSTGEASTASL